MQINVTQEQLTQFGLEVKPECLVWRGEKGKVLESGQPINFNLIIFNLAPIVKGDLDCFGYQRHTLFEQFDFPVGSSVKVEYDTKTNSLQLQFVTQKDSKRSFIIIK